MKHAARIFITGLLIVATLAACSPREAGVWLRRSGIEQPTRDQRVQTAALARLFWAEPCAANKYEEQGFSTDALAKTFEVPERCADHPAGWVDYGHSIFGPPIGLVVRQCESGGDYSIEYEGPKNSTASGAFQFLDSTWRAYGFDQKYGVTRAMFATPAQQDAAFVEAYNRDGLTPWAASKHCWGG